MVFYMPFLLKFLYNINNLFIAHNNINMYPSNQGNFTTQNNVIGSNPNQTKSPNVNQLPPPQFSNQGFLSPQAGSFNKNRNVYASTIHASTSSSNLSKPGFGRLQSMGRTIKDDSDPIDHRPKQVSPSFMANTAYNFSFKQNNDKGKLASSVIFQKNFDEDINRFPGFNLNSGNNAQVGTSKLDALYAKKQTNQVFSQQVAGEDAQDRRKRQIDAIKQELQVLNKRMENTVIKKEGEAKPYFQLPTRKTSVMNNIPPPSTFTEYFKSTSSSTTVTESNEFAGNKGFFDKFAKGAVNNMPSPSNFTESFKSGISSTTSTDFKELSGNKAFFDKFAKGGVETTSSLTQDPVINQAKVQQKLVQSPQIPTANIVKPEAGGMFKKKNPYLSDESDKTQDHAPKTLILSPKGVTLNQGFKAQPFNLKQQFKPQIKAAEMMQPVVVKKGMKRTSSSQNIAQGPKQFKKSDFAIGKKMGKGQFGEVMLVIHKETGFLCGMKVMSKKQIREEKYVNQIARQLSIQFYLNHRNVAPLYGYFQDEENVYLLIEYCTGGQLLQLLRKAHRMQQADASPIIREICQGLDYIHKQEIIHRDIKPQNILFNFNTVKICDFGWAVHCGSGMRKTVSGSPLYYSPEIVQQTEYDEKVDIWAIGMMTYECLMGKIPFKIYSQLDLNRIVEDQVKFPEYIDVSDDAKSFILGIMQKNPDDRMMMKDIFKHPFIRKYLAEKKVAPQIIDQFKRVLN